jgi:hypothetical protein
VKTFRPARLPTEPAPRRDGQPAFLGPPYGYRGPMRPALSVPPELRWRGYKGETALEHGRAVGGRWRDGDGQWWVWGTYA